METAIICILGIYLLSTVLSQLVSIFNLPNYQYFNLFPKWHFFAPNPLVSDYYLLYRVAINSNWTEIDLGYTKPPLYFLWNHNRRKKKVIIDAIAQLRVDKNLGEDKLIRLSFAYICILNYTTELAKYSSASHVQFSVIRTTRNSGILSSDLIIVSDLHRI